MAARCFDMYLWAQLVKMWLSLLELGAFILVEKLTRFGMLGAGYLVPLPVREWAKGRWARIAPRGMRGPTSSGSYRPEMRMDTVQLCRTRGYACEEHHVRSPDGHYLTMHRVPCGRAEAESDSVTGPRAPVGLASRPAVFLHHGFLQSSEVWVAGTNGLVFQLADAGFDVWMGNMRGNKYSCKHERFSPHDDRFWNYSLDEVAQLDLPAQLNYLLRETGRPSLAAYVGFSNGTAVAFACFSFHPDVARKVDLFVALAPCTKPKGFSNKIVDALMRASPDVVYLLLGRKRLLPSTQFWQGKMSVEGFTSLIEKSCRFLFGWDMATITGPERHQHYQHIYSPASVKSTVHWFQFMSASSSSGIQMYDDHRWRSDRGSLKSYSQPRYPVWQVRCPIAIFYGGRDTLPDTHRLIKDLPSHSVVVSEVPEYEHMCFMYANSAPLQLYPRLVRLCRAAAEASSSSSAASASAAAALPSPLSEGSGFGWLHSAVAADPDAGSYRRVEDIRSTVFSSKSKSRSASRDLDVDHAGSKSDEGSKKAV